MDLPRTTSPRRRPIPGRRPLSGEIGLREARAIIDDGRFWTEYQPLLDLHTERVIGYEALARFRGLDGTPVGAAPMFGVLHADPALLVRAELALKQIQLAHAPAGELFVNLDPDSWDRAGRGDGNPFLALLSGCPVRVTVEVIENMRATDAVLARKVVHALHGRGIPIALDDLGAADALVSFAAVAEAEVLKFDRSVVRRLSDVRHRALFEALVRMARTTGARTVLEGVETTHDLALARELGVDLVQGFLFSAQSVQSAH